MNVAYYIAQRYLFSKKGSTAVTFITWLAALAMTVAVAAMFIIISVFSGLEDLNRELISNLHADLTIRSTSGKTLKNLQTIRETLNRDTRVAASSAVIEEKVYIDYGGKGDVAVLRGVDSAYIAVNPIHKSIFYGTYPTFRYENEVLIENQLDNRLSFPVGSDSEMATLYMPKAGKGMINSTEDIFNQQKIFASGVFSGNGQLDNYIISPIELAQRLLQLPRKSAYELVIKLRQPELAERVKNELKSKFHGPYEISTKSEENAAFWKMINIEKLFIYAIFALVIAITTFNLAGAVTILQLDKKQQAKALIALGLPETELRKIYFLTGVLIVAIGIIAGLVIGTITCLIQQQTGVFKANENLSFPVRILPENYLIVSILAAAFGLLASWIFSKLKSNKVKIN